MAYGQVYVIRAGREDLFKVGHTKADLAGRLKALQTGCPYTLSIYASIPSYFPERLEHLMQGLLRSTRTHGEWFAATSQEIDTVLAFPIMDRNPWTLHGDPKYGVMITPSSWTKDAAGRPFVSLRCLTRSELEAEVYRLATGLLQLLDGFPDYPQGRHAYGSDFLA